MKILLDENIPVVLKQSFPGFEMSTVTENNWNGIKNGELLKLMTENKFDVLITLDKKLKFQQNLKELNITIILLDVVDARLNKLKQLTGQISEILNSDNLENFISIKDN